MNTIAGNIAYAASDVAMTNPCCIRASIVEKHNATADIERGGSGSTYHHPYSNARMTRTTLLIYHYAYLSLSVRKRVRRHQLVQAKVCVAGVWQKKRQKRPHIRGASNSVLSVEWDALSSKNYNAWHEHEQISPPTSPRSPASSESGPLSSNNLGGRPYLDYQCRETQCHRSWDAAEVGTYQHLCGRVV